MGILEQFGCAPARNGSAHALVSQYLRCSSSESAVDAATLLGNLHARRHQADYRHDKPEVETMGYGQYSVEQAHEAEKALSEFRSACDADPSLIDELRIGIERIRSVRGG
jgi:hypothetical protein